MKIAGVMYQYAGTTLELSNQLSNNQPLKVSYQIKKDISFLMKNEKYQAINKLDG